MTREETIRLSYALDNNALTNKDASMLLIQYCIENGKSYNDSMLFVTMVLQIPDILIYCILHALTWYQRKFNVIKLYSAPNPMETGDGRRIILIY